MAKKVEFRMGRELKKLLNEKNLAKKDLALFLGVTSPAITRCLNEQTNLNYDNLKSTCEWLNISADRILETGRYKTTALKEYAYTEPERIFGKAVPHQPDETGKTLLDYVLEQGDFDYFYFHHAHDHFLELLHCDPRVLKFIVETNEVEFLQQKLRSKIRSVKSGPDGLKGIKHHFEFPILDYILDNKNRMIRQTTNHEFHELTNYNKSILEIIFKSENKDLMDLLPYRLREGDYPMIVYYAIQQDNMFVIEYYFNKFKMPFTKEHFKYANGFGSYCSPYILEKGNFSLGDF